ncbi:MAG TPA: diaminopimelate epimerase [Candidatus Methylomirabilis sp.]|nr:diaminopimelate epimerase [Candidatus Methylomirabilis sp.]
MTRFVKSHGLGNDYIVLNEADLDFRITPEAVRRLCHRHYGVGSDGILLLAGPQTAPFVLRIFNPDGTEAEKSGNGIRIFAKYLFEHGYTHEKTFYIETKGGLVRVTLEGDRDRVTTVTVEMGRASFRSHDIPVTGEEREVVNEELRVDGARFQFTAVSMGNPHCVIPVDHLEPEEVRRLGPQIEHHPVFPNRTNVQFAKVRSRDRVTILIWERGAGYTLASGSSACAVAAACRRLGLTDDRVTIQMPGGDLDITIRPEWEITLRGPVSEVCTGTLSADLIDEIKKASPL